jgi:hypothetical protein
MSIDQPGKIDIISTNEQGNVVLHIADYLEWDSENEHILLLQDKINAYLQFIQSGQIFEEYPAAVNNQISIEIVFKHDPPQSSLTYLNRFKEIADELSFPFSWRIHNADD